MLQFQKFISRSSDKERHKPRTNRLLSKLKICEYLPVKIIGGGEMKFETVKELDDEKFRRLAGIKRTTFDKMVLILQQSSKDKKIYGGRKNKLSIENMYYQINLWP